MGQQVEHHVGQIPEEGRKCNGMHGEGEGRLFTMFQESENVIIWQLRRGKAGRGRRDFRFKGAEVGAPGAC